MILLIPYTLRCWSIVYFLHAVCAREESRCLFSAQLQVYIVRRVVEY